VVRRDDPAYADRRNFYKVEKWSGDGLGVELLLYAGNNLDKARRIFDRTYSFRKEGLRLNPSFQCLNVACVCVLDDDELFYFLSVTRKLTPDCIR